MSKVIQRPMYVVEDAVSEAVTSALAIGDPLEQAHELVLTLTRVPALQQQLGPPGPPRSELQ